METSTCWWTCRAPDSGKKSLTLAALLQQQLSDQPLDILVIDLTTPLQPTHRIARKNCIPL